MQNPAQSVDVLLMEANALFNARQDEEARGLSRIAYNRLFSMFHSTMEGKTLVKLLACLRSLAIEAQVTGRTNEGCMAPGTALTYATSASSTGLQRRRYWRKETSCTTAPHIARSGCYACTVPSRAAPVEPPVRSGSSARTSCRNVTR